jgi:hypothetical protein
MQNNDPLKTWPQIASSLINHYSKSNSNSQSYSETEQFSFQQSLSLSSENHDSFSQDLNDFPLLPKLLNYSSKDSSETYKNLEFSTKNFSLEKSKRNQQNKSEKNRKKATNSELEKQVHLLKTLPIKKSAQKSRAEKRLLQIKRLLAILKNWHQVCKTLPPEQQFSYKEKILDYVRRRMFPNLRAEKKQVLSNGEKNFSESNEKAQDSMKGLKNFFAFDERDEIMTKSQENNKNLFSENENNNNNFNFEEKNFFDFENNLDFINMEVDLRPSQYTDGFTNQFSLN